MHHMTKPKWKYQAKMKWIISTHHLLNPIKCSVGVLMLGECISSSGKWVIEKMTSGNNAFGKMSFGKLSFTPYN